MKRIILLVILVWGCQGAAADAALQAASEIKSVTLFLDRALVMREAEVSVKQGTEEILLDVHAFKVDPGSISARVFGEGLIQGVQLREVFPTDAPQEALRDLESRIQALEKQRRMLNDQKSALDKQAEFLDSLIQFSRVQLPQAIQTRFPSPDEIDQTLVFLGSRFGQIHSERRTVDDSLAEVDKNLKALQKELETVRGKLQGTAARAMEVTFESARAQTLRVQVEYLVEGAFWEPLYRVGVSLDPGEVQLGMFARVTQKTGEDWRGASLIVSNAVPSAGVGVPSLDSWWLDIPRLLPLRESQKLDRGAMAPMASRGLEEEGDAVSERAEFQEAERRESPLSFEYVLPRPVFIESRDKETLLPLFTKTLKGEFYWLAVPRQSPMVHLICRTGADSELLSGPMNIHFDGRFLGNAFMEEKRPGEDFRLNLGTDRQIKVSREKVSDKIKETYFGKIERDSVVREVVYRISLENLKERGVLVKLLDAVPISRTDRIQVREVNFSRQPSVKNYENREGVMLWEMELLPGEKLQLDISLVVSYPRDAPILDF